jgi:hypothetical protein
VTVSAVSGNVIVTLELFCGPSMLRDNWGKVLAVLVTDTWTVAVEAGTIDSEGGDT